MRLSITTVRELKKEDLDDWIHATCRAMWTNWMEETRQFGPLPPSSRPPTPDDFEQLKKTGRFEWTSLMGHTTVTTIYEVIDDTNLESSSH